MKKKAVSISPSKLIGFLKQQLNNLPDSRKGSNKQYQIEDAVIAAFSVFFTQCPSFLEHQKLMKKKKGKDNAHSLFGLSKIPCDNQIRALLDPIPAKKVFGAFETVWKWLDKNQIINQFKYLDNQILLAFDGTEYYCSKKINCPNCNCRNHRDGSTTYYHQVIRDYEDAPLEILARQVDRLCMLNPSSALAYSRLPYVIHFADKMAKTVQRLGGVGILQGVDRQKIFFV